MSDGKRPDCLWKPGQSGNPSGRPKGSRAKLAEDFVADLYADWQLHGPTIIARVREEKPADFLKIIASLLPRDINLKVDPLDDLDDATLAAVIEAARQAIALAQSNGEDERDEGQAAVH